jgi:hypothetical protein
MEYSFSEKSIGVRLNVYKWSFNLKTRIQITKLIKKDFEIIGCFFMQNKFHISLVLIIEKPLFFC